MRLIDADKLNTDIVVKRNALDTSAVVERGGYIALNKVLTMIEEQPTIEERKTGKWIDGKCDQCGKHAPFWSMATTYYLSNFCPNCGARMEANND